jgi:hypothetical protein
METRDKKCALAFTKTPGQQTAACAKDVKYSSSSDSPPKEKIAFQPLKMKGKAECVERMEAITVRA